MQDSDYIDIQDLEPLNGFAFPVYASVGGAAKARTMADRTRGTVRWLAEPVAMPATPPLFVLSLADWPRVALVPQYGLAHSNRTRIVIGLEYSGLWATLIPTVWPQLSVAGRDRLSAIYDTPPDASRFADLVVSHELTHLADRPSHLDSGVSELGWGAEPRVLWFTELFANLGLHGYICEREPDQLHNLETLFTVIGGLPRQRWPVHRLGQMYDALKAPGGDGTNCCWYEFRLQILAKRLWETAGRDGFQKIHAALHGPVLTDGEIIELIAGIDSQAARDIGSWNARI
jgi:hypothetical protein